MTIDDSLPTDSPSHPKPTGIPARLALEDGSVFAGQGFGCVVDPQTEAPVAVTGEVVFNTALAGYQEALTDPSYTGQILMMTTPMIGNYGISDHDMESHRITVRGFVIRELSRVASNHRSTTGLSAWLKDAGVLGIADIDTRALTRIIRNTGAMRGVLTTDQSISDADLVHQAANSPTIQGANLVDGMDTPADDSDWKDGLGDWAEGQIAEYAASSSDPQKEFNVVAIDCGIKRNILRHLTERGCEVTLLPANCTADDIRQANPDGLFVSNGPGDPAAVDHLVELLRQVVGTIPTFGICLGHQLLCLALGGKTYKLKFGHRGANQPVQSLLTGRVEITSQNHGFAVDSESLKSLANGESCEPTHLHMNDQTLAGFRHTTKPIFAVQYHPEASPGPHDSGYLFDLFIRMMETKSPISKADVATLPRLSSV